MLTQRYRTFVLDDRDYELEAIGGFLRKIPNIEIVGMSKTVSESMEICQRERPDLIIVDGKLYGNNDMSPAFVKNIRKILPQTRILGMTRYGECIDLLNNAGCNFVIDKNLIENQESFLNYIKETVLRRPDESHTIPAPKLNPTELKVLRFIGEGLTEDQIAIEMGFSSRKPVRRIKNTLFDKFGALNTPQLVHHAHLSGIFKNQ